MSMSVGTSPTAAEPKRAVTEQSEQEADFELEAAEPIRLPEVLSAYFERAAPPKTTDAPALRPPALPGAARSASTSLSLSSFSALPSSFEIARPADWVSDPFRVQLKGEGELFGTLTGSSDLLALFASDGGLECVAQRQPRDFAHWRQVYQVRSPEGGVLGYASVAWNGRAELLSPEGEVTAELATHLLSNRYTVLVDDEFAGEIERSRGGFRVSLNEGHGIDPRLLVMVPSLVLARWQERRREAR